MNFFSYSHSNCFYSFLIFYKNSIDDDSDEVDNGIRFKNEKIRKEKTNRFLTNKRRTNKERKNRENFPLIHKHNYTDKSLRSWVISLSIG